MKYNNIQKKKRKTRLLFFLLPLLLFYTSIHCLAQEEEPLRLRYQSMMLGIGSKSIHDSYLSPLTYKGTNFGFSYESLKMTNMLKGNISAQHLFDLEIAKTSNPSKTAKDYMGSIKYAFGLHHKFQPIKNLFLFGGFQAEALLGGIYNTRNGNNPATGKAHININLSGLASYNLNIKGQPFLVRYQLNIPFIGAFFSPHFGQSYYEIGLGVDESIVHFASLHNYQSMNNLLSVDIPIYNCTVRLAYSNWVYQTVINDLNTKIISNSFYLGFSRNIYSISGKRSNKYMKPFFEE
ncbi:MAG: DUF3316 domain-containing protein [Bacteroidales bacterium]|nr:DUF3316 domain-containing protein [Bacteroidales bacterium]